MGFLILISALKTNPRCGSAKLFSKTGKGFRFRYEYDFGDSWMHDVVFEGHFTQ